MVSKLGKTFRFSKTDSANKKDIRYLDSESIVNTLNCKKMKNQLTLIFFRNEIQGSNYSEANVLAKLICFHGEMGTLK